MTLNSLAGRFPDASFIRAFFSDEQASHHSDSSRPDLLVDFVIIILWVTLIYPIWLYPVVHGVRAAKGIGVSRHWMWFGINPLMGWTAFGIISRQQCRQLTPAPSAAPPLSGSSAVGTFRIQPGSFFKSFALSALVTALPFAVAADGLMAAKLADTPEKFGHAAVILLPICLGMGVGFGILFGLAMAALMKGTAISFPFQSRDLFASNLRIAIASIRYVLESEREDVLVYRPTTKAGLLSGKIYVQFLSQEARIVGPRWHLRKLSRVIQGRP